VPHAHTGEDCMSIILLLFLPRTDPRTGTLHSSLIKARSSRHCLDQAGTALIKTVLPAGHRICMGWPILLPTWTSGIIEPR
jgi:hypothetical protein